MDALGLRSVPGTPQGAGVGERRLGYGAEELGLGLVCMLCPAESGVHEIAIWECVRRGEGAEGF